MDFMWNSFTFLCSKPCVRYFLLSWCFGAALWEVSAVSLNDTRTRSKWELVFENKEPVWHIVSGIKDGWTLSGRRWRFQNRTHSGTVLWRIKTQPPEEEDDTSTFTRGKRWGNTGLRWRHKQWRRESYFVWSQETVGSRKSCHNISGFTGDTSLKWFHSQTALLKRLSQVFFFFVKAAEEVVVRMRI